MEPDKFLFLADALPESLIMITSDGTIQAANQAAGRMLNRDPDTLSGQPLIDIVENPAEQLAQHMKYWSRTRKPVPSPIVWRGLKNDAKGWHCQGFLLSPAGERQSACIIIRCVSGRSPTTEFLTLNHEVEKQQRTLRYLKESREQLSLEHEKAVVTLQSIGDAVITTDANGRIEYLNPVAEQLTGWQNYDAANKPLKEVFNVIYEKTRKPAEDLVERCIQEGRTVETANNTVLVSKDDSEYIIENSSAPIRNNRNEILGAVLVFHDVTGDRLDRRKLEYLAQHDTLTGLYNRHYFEQCLEKVVKAMPHTSVTHAMLYLDLDQFKIINDTAGHAVGDELLSEIAKLFANHINQGDVLARLGGDEFGILLLDIDTLGAVFFAEDLLEAIEKFRFIKDGRNYDISTSIGIAMIDQDILSPNEVLRHADIACYVAKHERRNCSHVYSEQDDADMAALGEMNLVNEIKDAIAKDRFELHFQPIIRTVDGLNLMYEVLLRIVNDDDELILPSTFISAAEHYGLMSLIDRTVVERSLEVLERYHKQGHRLSFTINLSGASMGDPDVLSDIKYMITTTEVEPSCLIFEVTETAAVAHIDNAATFMHELRSIGCRFALDDFGTGFSSFAYLKYLPVDYLKIDGAFIRDMVDDKVDQAMVRSINQIAHSLNKSTIAEFVENEDVMEQLRIVGVDLAQGYYLGKPTPTIEDLIY